MRFNHLLRLNNLQLSVIIKQPVKCLEDLWWCEIKLIKYNPIAVSDSLDEHSLLEHKFAILVIGRWDIWSEILLNIRVHMIIDTNHLVVGHIGQVLNRRGLTGGGWPLKDDGVIGNSNDWSESFYKVLEGVCEDEVILFEV